MSLNLFVYKRPLRFSSATHGIVALVELHDGHRFAPSLGSKRIKHVIYKKKSNRVFELMCAEFAVIRIVPVLQERFLSYQAVALDGDKALKAYVKNLLREVDE